MTLPTATISERSSSTKPPSTHVKALITWIAIFPLVTLSAYALAPFAGEWNPLLRSFVVSLIVVPAAVYIVVPQLMRSYTKIRGARTKDSKVVWIRVILFAPLLGSVAHTASTT